jgi:uncharacterized protein YkwD
MAVKRAFRPSDLDGQIQLEARVPLSQFGVMRQVVALAQKGGRSQRVAPRVAKPRKQVAFQGPRASAPKGPKAVSKPTAPVVVIPAPAPPVEVTTTSPSSPGTVPNVSGVMSSREQTIVDLVNQVRAEAGLAPLQVNSKLVQAAQIHSIDMAQLGRMEHTLSGAALPGLVDRIQYVGYGYSSAGENIAFNYPDENSVMTAWMNSTGHRANILNPSFTEIGVGIASDDKGQPYYTQAFGKPA